MERYPLEVAPIDLLLFYAVNNLAGVWPPLDWLGKTLAEGFPNVLMGIPFLLWFWPVPGRARNRCVAVLTVLAVLVALGTATLPPLLYYRPRPFEDHAVTLLVQTVPEPSFPSAHAAGAAAAATAMGVLGPWARWLGTAAALAVALSRVFVGVHYPLDVAGGLLLGWTAGALFRYNLDVLRPFLSRIVGGLEELL